MRIHPVTLARRAPALALFLGALLLAGCGDDEGPTRPATRPPAPEPNSPAAVVHLFDWCWDMRSQERFTGTLSGDMRFVFALGDSAGNAFRDTPFLREDVLLATQHLFVGGGPAPPATSIVLNFDPTLTTIPDDRPGKDPTWHRQVATSVDLTVKTLGGDYRITGGARFYVVRGDSAVLPPDLVAAGATPDSARWYIEEWVDETWGTGSAPARAGVPARVLPAAHYSWGDLLVLYRGPRPIP